jgi:hypothetical protein
MNLRNRISTACLLASVSLDAQAACSPADPESIDSFFQQYISSKEFAVSRTLYPYTTVVESEEGQQKIVVTKSSDAKYPSLSDYMAKNNMASDMEVRKPAQATLRVYAPNSGFSIRYNFILKQGCWYLMTANVVSM